MKFIGTARTSLVVTIGPSPRHRGETTSTIMFGQRVSFYAKIGLMILDSLAFKLQKYSLTDHLMISSCMLLLRAGTKFQVFYEVINVFFIVSCIGNES